MATYLSGVTDHIPAIQPWQPDFNFYNNTLNQKQSTYDQNWDKVNSVYNSVLNAPMMRDDNLETRDKFFKDIEEQLVKISSVDLSLEQNVMAANNVFKPFYENDSIIKDIGFTNTYQNELQRAEALRNCTDPKTCGGKYWEGGVRAMNYQAEDFRNASTQEALGMAPPKYTPYVNFMEKATAAAKEAGLSVKYDSIEGGYIVTTKNGPELQVPLMNFFMARFGDDPAMQEFYKTKAYLITKENPDLANEMYKQTFANPGADPKDLQNSVEQTNMSNTYENASQVINTKQKKETMRFSDLVKKKRVLEERIQNKGIILGSIEHDQYLQLEGDIELQSDVVDKLTGMVDHDTGVRQGIKDNGLKGNERQMRSVIANAMQMQDMYGAASSLAYKDYERTMKADPYALESKKHSNAVSLASMKNIWDTQNKTMDFIFDKALKNLDNKIKDGTVSNLGNDHWLRPPSGLWDLAITPNPGGVGGTSDGDLLAQIILSSIDDPYSGATVHGSQIQKLITQGRVGEALQLAQTNTRNTNPVNDLGVIGPNVDYTTTAAGEKEGTNNLLMSTIDKVKFSNENPLVPLTGGVGLLAQAVDKIYNESITPGMLSGMRADYDKALSGLQGSLDFYDNYINIAEEGDNNARLNLILSNAADGGALENDAATLEFLTVGSTIQDNLKKLSNRFSGTKDYASYSKAAKAGQFGLPQLTEEEYKTVQGMPTLSSTGNAVPAYFTKIQNIGSDKLAALAGGHTALYEKWSDGQGVWVQDPNSGKFIDKESANLMSDSEYSQVANMIQEEASKSFDEPGYKDHMITPEMRKAVTKYDMFNNGAAFERSYGTGTDMYQMKAHNENFAEDRSFRNLTKSGNEKAVKVWNDAVMAAQAELPHYAGLGVPDRLKEIIREAIVIDKGEGKPMTIAKDYQVIDAIAKEIPNLIADPSWMQGSIFHDKWGMSITDITEAYAKDGNLSNQGILNLLSTSEFASRTGAEENGLFGGSTKPAYETYSSEYIPAIAGYMYHEDQKLPLEERKFKSVKEATIAAVNADPYKGGEFFESTYNTQGLTREDVFGDGPGYGMVASEYKGEPGFDNERYDPASQKFLQYLGKYGDALTTNQGGGEWNVKPNYKYWNTYSGHEGNINTSSTMSFNLDAAEVDNAWVNVLEDHTESITRVYKKFIENFSDQASPIGGSFTGPDGRPMGIGSTTALTANVRDINPQVRNQNYKDAVDILAEAVNRGEYDGANPEVGAMLNKLSSQMNDEFTKGSAPLFNISVSAGYGGYDRAKYTLDFTDNTWLTGQGYNKIVDGQNSLPMESSVSWIVENPTEPIASGALPNSFDMVLGTLATGESWTDNSLRSEYGTITYSKLKGNQFSVDLGIEVFDWDQGKEVHVQFNPITEIDYGSTNWPTQHAILLEKMRNIKAESNRTKAEYTRQLGTQNLKQL